MKKIFTLLLTLLLLLLPSCGKESETTTTDEKESEEVYTETLEIFKEDNTKVDSSEYPEISQVLSWDTIDDLPKKKDGMTVEEMREMCVEFFRFAKTVVWTPDDNATYQYSSGGSQDSVEKGTLYSGLPYVSTATGNIYRLMDFMDPETGVVDIKSATENVKLFGAQCSVSAYWAWARCINSANYSWTYASVVSNGFLRVGPYTYDDSISMFSAENSTRKICDTNGKQTMFESYAKLQPADGIVYYINGGHTMMCISEPTVVRDENGNIDGDKSFLYYIDQSTSWTDYVNEFGEKTRMKNALDVKITFNTLFTYAYVPFTFAEFQETDPVEETKCTFSHTGGTITPDQLKNATVTANYGISDIYAVLCSRTGKEVTLGVSRAKSASKHELNFLEAFGETDLSQYANGKYTIKIVCQLGTGERPTVYEGTFVSEDA